MTNAVEASPEEALEGLLGSLSEAADLIVTAVNVGAEEDPGRYKTAVHHGVAAILVEEDPVTLLRDLVPAIRDVPDDHPQVIKLRMTLIPYLRQRGLMAPIINVDAPERSVWAVKDTRGGEHPQPSREPAARTPAKVRRVCAECGTAFVRSAVGRPPQFCSTACRRKSAARRAKHQSIQPVTTADGRKLWPCDECAFVGVSLSALTLHRTRLKGFDHPKVAYPCPEEGCGAVYVSTPSYRRHMVEEHGAAPAPAPVRVNEPGAAAEPVEGRGAAPAPAPVLEAPDGAPVTLDAAAQAVLALLRRNRELEEGNERLRAELDEERRRREALEAALREVTGRLQGLLGH